MVERIVSIARVSRALVALLALSVVVFSKVPTSKCQCHTKKATPQSRAECPFGKLRALAGTIHIAAKAVLVVNLPREPGQIVVHRYPPPLLARMHSVVLARGPPQTAARIST